MSKCNFKVNSDLEPKTLRYFLTKIEGKSTLGEIVSELCIFCESYREGHLCKGCIIVREKAIAQITPLFKFLEKDEENKEDEYLIPKEIAEIMCLLFPLLIIGAMLMNYLPGLAFFVLLGVLLRSVYLWGKEKGKGIR